MFADFGPSFQVEDATGEEPEEILIGSITVADTADEAAAPSEVVVSALQNERHPFEDGDEVTFREMPEPYTPLNAVQRCPVRVISPSEFAVPFEAAQKGAATTGQAGIARQLPRRTVIEHRSLAANLKEPALMFCDLVEPMRAAQCWLALQAYHRFLTRHRRTPIPWAESDSAALLEEATAISSEAGDTLPEADPKVMHALFGAAAGAFAPLAAAVGGIAAQEVLKALTGKFGPLSQVWCFEAIDLAPSSKEEEAAAATLAAQGSPRTGLIAPCLGPAILACLAEAKLFLVGCGAIGCEMLKNLALLGACDERKGGVLVATDDDVIEKSNLNRQFLFRPRHIGQHKSSVAVEAAVEMHPHLYGQARQLRVGPETEQPEPAGFDDTFFEAQSAVINALDNVAARLYVDSRCLSTRRALIESGTMGAKGHVQTVVPHLTENYGAQRDPEERSVPYCTLKSFPYRIEHTVQWARDKFGSLFELKPAAHNRFWQKYPEGPASVAQRLKEGDDPDGAEVVAKLLRDRPETFAECVATSRCKFEKYFNHRVRHQLNAFPPDTLLADGSPFWSNQKRLPVPLDFDIANPEHLAFVTSCARLMAERHGIVVSEADCSPEAIGTMVLGAEIPSFVPKSAEASGIVTNEDASPAEVAAAKAKAAEAKSLGPERSAGLIASYAETEPTRCPELTVAEFEKDDDANGHIDFITAASNLRAANYRIEPSDRFKTKRIAGRIVPAIATTTAAVAGLATIELVKALRGGYVLCVCVCASKHYVPYTRLRCAHSVSQAQVQLSFLG